MKTQIRILTGALGLALLCAPAVTQATPLLLLKGKSEAARPGPGPGPVGPSARSRGPVPPPAAAVAIGSRAGAGFVPIDGPRRYGLPPLAAGRTYMQQGNSIFEVDQRTLTVLALAAILR